MKQYKELLKRILGPEGLVTADRTGVGTRSVFGHQLSFNLQEAFPLVTIKKTLYKTAFTEMIWFLRGEPNINYLKERGVKIWNEWANEQGYLGPIYGVQWRNWPGKIHAIDQSFIGDEGGPGRPKWTDYKNYLGRQDHRTVAGDPILLYQEKIDQVKNVIESIKNNPASRRHIVTAWNPGYLDEMALMPCHRDFQCYAPPDGTLSLMVNIRSSDTMLGLPFNIAQYALLTHMLAQVTERKVGKLVVTLGDAHIYTNHLAAAQEIITLTEYTPTAKLVIKNSTMDIDQFTPEDFEVVDYESHPFVHLPVAV